MPIDPRMVKWDDAPPVDAVEWDEETPNFGNVQKGFGTKQSKKPVRRQNPLYMASPIGAAGALIDMAQGGPATDAAGRAAVHSVTGVLHGGAELAQRGFRAGVNALIPAPEQNLSGLITGQAPKPQGVLQQLRQRVNDTVDADIAAGQKNEAAYRASLPDTTSAKVGQVVGDTALMFVPAAKAAKLATVPRYLAAAGTGAAFGGAQPIVDGESRGVNAALGGALNVLGQGTSDALMAGGKAAAKAITPELRALYERARAAGINLTPAQLSNSEFVKRVSAQLGKLPFAGGQAVASNQRAAGNRELAKLIGQDADSVTPQVMANAADEIGAKFDTVFKDGMRYDRQFLRELGALRQEAAGLDDTAKNALEILIKRVQKQAQNGQITGHTLQSIDQQARKWATGGGDRHNIAEAFRESLHETFGRQAPAGVKQLWDTARKQWATLKTLEPVVARNTEGGVPLEQLQGAINAKQAGRTARSRGRDGDLGLLASAGQRIKAPNSSGTPEGLLAMQAANPLAWPVLGLLSAGGLATRATLNNPRLAPLLMRQGRGQGRQLVAPYARPLPMGLLPYLPHQVAAAEGE